jgi:deoxyribose-phosphate aldolase
VAFAAELLGESEVFVSTVVGFPHGSSTTATKVFESERALEDGARELDMVLNIGRVRSGRAEEVGEDIAAVVRVAAASNAIVKVILENAYLDDSEKELACRLAEEAGAAFVKTSTGFAPSGATINDLKLMRRSVGPHVQVKAAGGVRTLDALLEVMAVGVTRIGATATETILEDFKGRKADLDAVVAG